MVPWLDGRGRCGYRIEHPSGSVVPLDSAFPFPPRCGIVDDVIKTGVQISEVQKFFEKSGNSVSAEVLTLCRVM